MTDETPKAETPKLATPAVPLAPPTTAVVTLNARAKKILKRPGWAASPDVCDFVERAAAVKKSQKSIAAMLGKPLRTFEDALAANKGDNPLRLAYEAGAAKWEQDKIDIWNSLDPRIPQQMIGAMFAMKALAGWRDKPDIQTIDGPKITLVLPDSYSREEYMKQVGQTPSPPAAAAKQLGGVKVGDMTDVTPGADGKLPTLGPKG